MAEFSLQGKRVVVQGRVPNFPRRSIGKTLDAFGAELCSTIDGSIDALLNGTGRYTSDYYAKGLHIPVFEGAILKSLLTHGTVDLPEPPAPTRDFDALSGDLRAALARPLDEDTWAIVQTLLDDCIAQDIAQATHYVSDHLAHADQDLVNALCTPSSEWIRALSMRDESPKYGLVRHLCTSRLDGAILPQYMAVILASEHLTGLRTVSNLDIPAKHARVFKKDAVVRTLSQVTKLKFTSPRIHLPVSVFTAMPALHTLVFNTHHHKFAKACLLHYSSALRSLELQSDIPESLGKVLGAIQPRIDEFDNLTSLRLHMYGWGGDRLDAYKAIIDNSTLYRIPYTLDLLAKSEASNLVCKALANSPESKVRHLILSGVRLDPNLSEQAMFSVGAEGQIEEFHEQHVLKQCILDTGLGEVLDKVTLGERFSPEECQALREKVSATVHAPHEETTPLKCYIPAPAHAEDHDQLMASSRYGVQDALNAAGAVGTLGFKAFVPIVDWLHANLDEASWLEAIAHIKTHPALQDGIEIPSHWHPLLFAEEKDARLELGTMFKCLDFDFNLKRNSSRDYKRAAEWIEHLATAKWIDVISKMDVSFYRFTGQKSFIKALIKLMLASSPDLVTTNIKRDSAQAKLRDALEEADALAPRWNPPWRDLIPEYNYDETDEQRELRAQEYDLTGLDALRSMYRDAPTAHAISLNVIVHKEDDARPEAPADFAHLYVLRVESYFEWFMDDDTAMNIAHWVSKARPTVIEVDDMNMLHALVEAGVYSRAYGSHIALSPYITSAQLTRLFDRDDVRAYHLGLDRHMSTDIQDGQIVREPSGMVGYETPPEEELTLVDAMRIIHPDMLRHVKSLSWTFTTDELPHLGEILERMPNLVRLELSVLDWPSHAAAYLKAFAAQPRMKKLDYCKIFDHWSMEDSPSQVKQLSTKQKKQLIAGVGLRPEALLISNLVF